MYPTPLKLTEEGFQSILLTCLFCQNLEYNWVEYQQVSCAVSGAVSFPFICHSMLKIWGILRLHTKLPTWTALSCLCKRSENQSDKFASEGVAVMWRMWRVLLHLFRGVVHYVLSTCWYASILTYGSYGAHLDGENPQGFQASMPSSFQTSWATTFTPPGPTCATGSDSTDSQWFVVTVVTVCHWSPIWFDLEPRGFSLNWFASPVGSVLGAKI